jgi:hypothetical protein
MSTPSAPHDARNGIGRPHAHNHGGSTDGVKVERLQGVWTGLAAAAASSGAASTSVGLRPGVHAGLLWAMASRVALPGEVSHRANPTVAWRGGCVNGDRSAFVAIDRGGGLGVAISVITRVGSGGGKERDEGQ